MSVKKVARGAGGRPSADVGEKLNRKIMDIATKIFLTDGYAATSVDTIAKKVGCSKPTIYRRYSSKEDLFKAVLHNRCRRLSEVAQNAEFSHQEPIIALKELLAQFLDFCLEPQTLETYRIIVTDAQRMPSVASCLSSEIMKPFYERIELLLKQILGWPNTQKNHMRLEVLSRHLPGFFLHWPMRQAFTGIDTFSDPKERRQRFLVCWEMIEAMIQEIREPIRRKTA